MGYGGCITTTCCAILKDALPRWFSMNLMAGVPLKAWLVA